MKHFLASVALLILTYFNGNCQFPSNSFGAKIDVNNNGNVQSLISHDFNGDGKVDIVASNSDMHTLTIFVNNISSGGFKGNSLSNSFSLNTIAANPNYLKFADINGDGKEDILLGYSASLNNKFSIFLNKFNGQQFDSSSFERIDFTSVSRPSFVVADDIDGDSKKDLVVTNYNSSSISIFRNLSTGSSIDLASPITFSAGSEPGSAVIEDLDNDGKKDLAIGNWSSASISIYRNTSVSGSILMSLVTTLSSQTNPNFVRAVDFDNDGLKDILVSNWGSSTISFFKNITTSNISFAQRFSISLGANSYPQSSGCADFDADSKIDVAVAMAGPSNIGVFKNIGGSGSLSAASFSTKRDFPSKPGPVGLIVADLDNDLRPDLIVGNYTDRSLSLFQNRMLASEPTIQSKSLIISSNGTSINLNLTKGNGNRRLILVKANSPVDALPMDTNFYTGNPVFMAGSQLGSGNYVVYSDTGTSINITGLTIGTYYHFAVFEYNGIGGYSNYLIDPLIGNNVPDLKFPGNAFAPKVDYIGFGNIQSLVAFDFDGDGKTEIASSNSNNHSLTIYVNGSTTGKINSTSISRTFNLPALSANPNYIKVSDINGDGKGDILLGYSADNNSKFSIFLNQYNGTFLDSTSFVRYDFAGGVRPSFVIAQDLDGDSKNDLIVTNYNNSSFSVYKNTSTLTSISFNPPTIYSAGTNAGYIAVDDLDNDGKKDIAVGNWSASSITIYKNNSSASAISLSFVSTLSAQNNPNHIRIVDLDNDGYKDIVASNWASSSVSCFKNISSTTIEFSNKFNLLLGANANTQASGIADFDADGNFDIAVAMAGKGAFGVFHNTGQKGNLSINSFSGKTDYTTNSGPVGLIVADFDNDFRPDVIVGNYTSQNLSIHKNQILFPEPTVQATALNISYATGSVTLKFFKGNGNRRLVLVKESSPVDASPKDTSFYSANSVFGSGTEISNGNFVVYSDTGNSVTITGLISTKSYYFSIFEYNGFGGYSNYLLNNPLSGNTPVSINEDLKTKFGLAVYPNPFDQRTNISLTLENMENVNISVFDLQGRLIKNTTSKNLTPGLNNIELDESFFGLPGVYLLRLDIDGVILQKTVIRH